MDTKTVGRRLCREGRRLLTEKRVMCRRCSDTGKSLETSTGKSEKCKMYVVLQILRKRTGRKDPSDKRVQMQTRVQNRICNRESYGERKEKISAETGR